MDLRPRRKAAPKIPTLPPPPADGSLRVLQVDFAQYGFPELSTRTCIIIDNLLTPEDMRKLYTSAVSSGEWKAAEVNIGGGRQVLATDYRNSDRIILDSHEVAGWLFDKIQPYLPAHVVSIPGAPHHSALRSPAYKEAKEQSNQSILGFRVKAKEPVARCTRLNERLRFLRYEKGMFFNRHCDGQYWTPDKKEVSYYTLQVYLSGEEDEGEQVMTYIERAVYLTALVRGSRVPRRRSYSYFWQRQIPRGYVLNRYFHWGSGTNLST
jgi:hypothetical protein